MRVSGFTIVRNARLLDYPFLESVRSLVPLCEEIIINLGDSTDDTNAMCGLLIQEVGNKIQLIRSVWNRENQTGGFQLKLQSDVALAQCAGDWCVYLQADEVLHEGDTDRIKQAMWAADQRPEIDGIVFQYIHFYGNFDYYITGRNWYRREVRAFKNHRGITAFRDAQGFRKDGKRLLVLASGAHVYHYGHVRSATSLEHKPREMSQWWGEAPILGIEANSPRRHLGLRRFRGKHPAVMVNKIRQNASYLDPSQGLRKWDKNEIKNAITMVWEAIVPYRIGEFRNYDITK